MKHLRRYIRQCMLQDLKNIDCERDGVCMQVAELVVKRLLEKGFEDFRVIEGYVWTYFGIDDQYPTAHTWIQVSNGEIIDLSEAQFDKYGGIAERIQGTAYNDEDEFYGESKYYSPQEYLNLTLEHPNDISKWLKQPTTNQEFT